MLFCGKNHIPRDSIQVPGNLALQGGGDCLPVDEVVGQLEVSWKTQPLVDLLLVAQLAADGSPLLLTKLHPT